MSIFGGGETQAPAAPVVPPPLPPPPAFGMTQGSKPRPKSQQTTFLGGDAPPTQSATPTGKTLLGA